MNLTKQQEKEVMQVYEAYWDSYLKGDMKAMASFLDDDFKVIGSTEGEVFFNKKEAMRFYKATAGQIAGKAEFRNRSIKVQPIDGLILITEQIDFYIQIDREWTFYSKGRLSSLLQKKEKDWKFIHQHGSMPDTRTEEGEQVASEKIAAENLQLRDAIKRRTVELENKSRELEIEASLERVRAVAMGMNKSEDLLSICEISFKEFKRLGFDNLRNAVIHMLNDENRFFIDYDYSDYLGGSIININYDSHPVIENYLEQIKKTEDAFAEVIVEGKELDSWKDFRRSGGQLDDPRLDGIPALYYYLYSIGVGDIGISTFSPINESQVKILKRFRNVFDLAYRRYTDITKAEAQAREAQIELGLERVRARAMAMHKSEELSELVNTVFKELTKLDFTLKWCIINIIDESTMSNTVWAANPDINKTPESYHMLFEDYPFHDAMMKGYKERATKYIYVLEGIEKKVYDEYLFNETEFRKVPAAAQAASRAMEKYVVTFSFSNFGGLQTVGEVPLSDTNIDILSRFGKVFDLTYTRFNDLKKAEAQAREAKIEAALERVRSRTMGMQKSEELKEVIQVVYEQFVHLNILVEHAGFIMDYKARDDMYIWLADRHEVPFQVTIPYFDSPHWNSFNEAKEKGMDFFANHLTFEEKNKFYQDLFKLIPDVPEETLEFYFSCPGLAGSTVLLENVGLYIENFSGIPYSDEENNTLMRFGKVFQQTYTRFLDLQKAEAQAREAQIEIALERVRARTMAMQNSNELVDTSTVLFHQLKILGIDSIRTGVATMDEMNETVEVWSTSGMSGNFEKKILGVVPANVHPMFTGIFNSWKNKESYFAYELEGDELKKYYGKLSSYLSYPEQKEFNEREMIYTFFFPEGSLNVVSFNTLTEDECNVTIRFANVFGLVYRRFLDLKQAEAQAREAVVEAALEKVRGRAMAMHNSTDLSATTGVVFTELRKLGISSIRCGVVVLSKSSRQAVFYSATNSSERDSLTLIGSVEMSGHAVFEKQYESWLKNENYFTSLGNEELRSYYKILFSRLSTPYTPRELGKEKEYGYYFAFSEGLFYAWTDKQYSENEINVLNRFKAIFDLTFRRYLDLQKAEAQAREALIEVSLERVRSKAMAMHSPNDLSETVNVFFKELKTLGIIPIRCGVGQIDGATRTTSLTTTTSSQQGNSFQVIGKIKQTGHPVLDGIFDHWKLQKEYHPVLEGEDIKAYYEVMNAQIGYPEYPEGVTQYGNCFFFKEGFVFAWTENLLSEEELIIFRRFTSVLSLTYRRYLDLKEAEERNKIIQAENDRKTKELEEARQLQLSLLPRTLPQLPQFDIAVYMKTATEVGGDYYDFNVQANGVLNLGIGDATGHGLQAGTMITLMKGFFTSDVTRFSPQKFLEHCNGIIRDIKLGRILMSFSHLRFENNSLLISSAGMPPVYYHHKKNNRTEEIIIQGLPLGALQSASYKLVEKELNSGDTILLLTDGLPEQMNSHKVIFDYSRVLKYFDEIAKNTPNEIINCLVQKADDWMDGQKQSDDVTFVVIKVK